MRKELVEWIQEPIDIKVLMCNDILNRGRQANNDWKNVNLCADQPSIVLIVSFFAHLRFCEKGNAYFIPLKYASRIGGERKAGEKKMFARSE